MRSLPRLPGIAGALRVGVSFGLCGALAATLCAVGWRAAALGVGLGLALYLVNAALLLVTLATLARGEAPRRGAIVAILSGLGRYLLLGLCLAWIAVALGRETFLGAGGGLALAQLSLLFRRSAAGGGASCEKSSGS